MLDPLKWLVIIVLAVLLLGRPDLLREVGHLLREMRKAMNGTLGEIGEVKQEIQEAADATKKDIGEIATETQKVIEEALVGPADPLRVFICSMQEELKPERAAVEERLRQLGKEMGLTRPLLFESLPASPDTPEEVYRRAVERCDVFVMIVAEDVSPPILREHQLAVEKKKPCFYFVKSVEQHSDAAQRFLSDVAAKWAEFQTPEELTTKVIIALVTDLLENYRQRRLAYADVLALLALGKSIQIDPKFLERAKEKVEQEQDFGRHPWEPETIYIPAGWFWMGTPAAQVEALIKRYDIRVGWIRSEAPQRRLYLNGYRIGKYPVTNAQYSRFVEATKCNPPGHWTDGAIPAGRGDHPVVHVSWKDAVAYCKWLAQVTGKLYRLPSDAEWERAARGSDARMYPWGNDWDASRCNVSESGPKDTTAVGQYSPRGDSPYGCADMAGNVCEWTSSLIKSYPYRADDGREDMSSDGDRVLRGGSFGDLVRYARAAFRHQNNPRDHDRYSGFRVGVAAPF